MISVARKGKINILRLVLGAMRTNTYLVYGEDGQGFIIDPAAESDIIRLKVTDLKLDIKGILLTHGHFDHIGALEDMRRLYGVKVYALDREKEILESSENNLSAYFGEPFTARADEYLTDGQSFELAGFSIKVIATPGHTCGSVCYLVEKEAERALISGDTLFAGSFGRYDFPTGNYRELMESIKDKLLSLPEDLKVYPGHNEETDIGSEKPNYIGS